VSNPGNTAIPVTLTSPPKGVKQSGFGIILGPGAGTLNNPIMIGAGHNHPFPPPISRFQHYMNYLTYRPAAFLDRWG